MAVAYTTEYPLTTTQTAPVWEPPGAVLDPLPPQLIERRIHMQAKAFIKRMEGTSLKTLLGRVSRGEVDGRTHSAFFKQKGYLARLLGKESWFEWAEERTSLGKVVQQLNYCMHSSGRVGKYVRELDGRIMREAQGEAEALLGEGLPYSCTAGLVGGAVGSVVTKSPIPMMWGLSQCFSTARAQEFIGDEFQVNTFATGDQNRPAVASLPDGKFAVVWDSAAQGAGIYGQIFDRNAGKIGGEFVLSSGLVTNTYDPDLTVLTNRNFIAVWESYGQDGSEGGVFGQIFDENGLKSGNQFQVNTLFTNLTQGAPTITTLNNDKFVVIWAGYGQDSDGRGVYGQRYEANGSPIGSEFLVNTFQTGHQDNAHATTLEDQNFLVVWNGRGQLDSLGIYGQIFDESATKIGNEFLINTFTSSDQTNPRIASFVDSSFIVVWDSQQDGSGRGVYGQRFAPNGTKLDGEFQVNVQSIDTQDNPSVITFSDKSFFITWDSKVQDLSLEGIYGQLFDSTGVRTETVDLQINAFTNNSQERSIATDLNNGRFVVIWESRSQDGSGDGVFGRLLTNSLLPTPLPPPSPLEIVSSSMSAINDLTWLWALLGTGAGVLCLSASGYFLYKNRINALEEGSAQAELSGVASIRIDKGHTQIGAYDLINKISRDDADLLETQTGVRIGFADRVERTKVLLGKGSFGKLRIARHCDTGSFVGVKKIKGETEIQASLNEGAIQQKLDGIPNIMPLLDSVETVGSQKEPVLYQFMPLAGSGNGDELRDRLQRSPHDEVLIHVAASLLNGLQGMHEKGIAHLDLKPSNFVIDKQGEVFIIDFGCAIEIAEEGIGLGDVRYFSPERLASTKNPNTPIDAKKVDAWALGITLLELATGDHPFSQASFAERLGWNLSHFQQLLDTISGEGVLMPLIKGLLDPNPDTRLTIKDAHSQFIHQSLVDAEGTFKSLMEVKIPEPKIIPNRNEDENYQNVYESKYGGVTPEDYQSF